MTLKMIKVVVLSSYHFSSLFFWQKDYCVPIDSRKVGVLSLSPTTDIVTTLTAPVQALFNLFQALFNILLAIFNLFQALFNPFQYLFNLVQSLFHLF